MMGCHQPSERFKGTDHPFRLVRQGPAHPRYRRSLPPAARSASSSRTRRKAAPLASSNDVTMDARGPALSHRPPARRRHHRDLGVLRITSMAEADRPTMCIRSARRIRTCRSIRRCGPATSSSSRARLPRTSRATCVAGTIEEADALDHRVPCGASWRSKAPSSPTWCSVTTYLDDARDFGRYNKASCGVLSRKACWRARPSRRAAVISYQDRDGRDRL